MGVNGSRLRAVAEEAMQRERAAALNDAATQHGSVAPRVDGAAVAPATPQRLPELATTALQGESLGYLRASLDAPSAAVAAYVEQVVQLLRQAPDAQLPIPELSARCPLPPNLRLSVGYLAILRAHADVFDVYKPQRAEHYYARLRPLVPGAEGAAAALIEPRLPPQVPSLSASPQPSAVPAGPPAVAGDVAAEEDALVGRIVAYFNAREQQQPPQLNAVAGACQLTPLLRQKYGTLRNFVSQPASARRGVRFSVAGELLELQQTMVTGAPPPPPAFSDGEAVEAAYIARVVQLLRESPGAQLSLPKLGSSCPLPVGFKARGCLAVLLAHPEKLEVVRPVQKGDHFVRLRGAADAQPAKDNNVETAFKAEVVARLRAAGVRNADGLLTMPLDRVASSEQSLWRRLKLQHSGSLRKFLSAHPDLFATSAAHVVLRASCTAEQPPAAPAVAVPRTQPTPPPAAGTADSRSDAIEIAFVADLVTRLRSVGMLALEHVAPGTESPWQSFKPRYGKLRKFLDAHADVFATTTTHVMLRTAVVAQHPPAPINQQQPLPPPQLPPPPPPLLLPPPPRLSPPPPQLLPSFMVFQSALAAGSDPALRREEEALIGRLVAHFRAKNATSLPLHSIAGACQLTTPLRRKYKTLRAFLTDTASAHGGARFRTDGATLVLLSPAPAAAAATTPTASKEAVYIAKVVRQLRCEPSGQISLPTLGQRCKLPAGLRTRGCLAVLEAHRNELEVFKLTKRGEHFVRLAQLQSRFASAPAVPAEPAVVGPDPAEIAYVEGIVAALRAPHAADIAAAPRRLKVSELMAGTLPPCVVKRGCLGVLRAHSMLPTRALHLFDDPPGSCIYFVRLVQAGDTVAPVLPLPQPAALPAAAAAVVAGPPPEAVAYAAAVAARLAVKRTMLLSTLGEALPMPAPVRLRYSKLRACLAAFPALFVVTESSVALLRPAKPTAAAAPPPLRVPPPPAPARPLTPPPRPLVAFAPLPKKVHGGPSLTFSMQLPWSDDGIATLAVRMPRRDGVAAALAWLTADDEAAPPPLVDGAPVRLLGVDVETDALCETSLVQLSTASRCVLIRWRGLAAPGTPRDGFDALCALLADDSWLKVGCELRKDAIDLLHDSGLAMRMRGGRDVTPALLRPGAAGLRGAVYGLVDAFNLHHGTALKKDKAVTCSDWDLATLSTEQLEYAALDAWLSFRVGAANNGELLQHHETRRIDIPRRPERLPGALAAAGGLLRECRVAKDAGMLPSDCKFNSASWDGDGKLRVLMAQYDTKLHLFDRCEVTLAGYELPWLALVQKVTGRTAVLKADARAGATQLLLIPGVRPVMERITIVRSTDLLAEVVYKALLDLAAPRGPLRFATAHVLDSAAEVPPPRAPPLARLPAGVTVPWVLNAAQAECVDDVAAGAPLTLTLGPPGTGKTTTIAAVAWSLATRAPADDARRAVVVLTQQNVAALNVLKALIKAAHHGAADVKLVISKDYYHEWHEHEYDPALLPFMHVTGFEMPDGAPQVREPRGITVLTFGVASGLAESRGAPVCDRDAVGALLVDEASQAWSALALLADAALPHLRRVHLFGDDRQLPPTLSPYDKSAAAVSAAAHLRSMYDAARTGGHAAHALRVQYRMPHRLATFLSSYVYGGILESAPGMVAASTAVTWLGAAHGAMSTVATFARHGSGGPRASNDARSSSPSNAAEVVLIDALLRLLDSRPGMHGAGAGSCVVLTPYTAQREALERRCAGSRANGGRWDVKTVDSFQGREADLVVVSLVRTDGIAGFMRDLRRSNVLLSRARLRLYIVGNHGSWARARKSDLWQAFAATFPPPAGATALRTVQQINAVLAADRHA